MTINSYMINYDCWHKFIDLWQDDNDCCDDDRCSDLWKDRSMLMKLWCSKIDVSVYQIKFDDNMYRFVTRWWDVDDGHEVVFNVYLKETQFVTWDYRFVTWDYRILRSSDLWKWVIFDKLTTSICTWSDVQNMTSK